jgi:acyl-CoA synthetase (AMP-forming)/AMP-acid ligase II
LAKIIDSREGTVWHRMGDAGYLDHEGRLWFCGRKSHRVVTSRGTLFTIPCEAVFNVHPDVFRSALVGVPVGDEVHPAICIEREPSRGVRPWREIERELREFSACHPHTSSIQAFLEHPAFPVDIRHNAKIFRERLAMWTARRLARHRWPAHTERISLPPTYDEWLAAAGGVKR